MSEDKGLIKYGDMVVVWNDDTAYIGHYLFKAADGIYLSRVFFGGLGCVGIICNSEDVFFVKVRDPLDDICMERLSIVREKKRFKEVQNMELENRMPEMLKYIEARVIVDNCNDCTFPKNTPECAKCYNTLSEVYKKAYCGIAIVGWEPEVDWDSVKSPYRMNVGK